VKDDQNNVIEYVSYHFKLQSGAAQVTRYTGNLNWFNSSYAFQKSDNVFITTEGSYTFTVNGAGSDPYGLYLDVFKIKKDHPNVKMTITDIKVDGKSISFDDSAIEEGSGDAATTYRRYIVNPWGATAASASNYAVYQHSQRDRKCQVQRLKTRLIMKMKYIAGVMLLAAGMFSLSSCNTDEDYAIANGNILSSVVTGEAAVTATTATTAGTVLDLNSQESSAYSVGVVYGTSADPTSAGTKKAGVIDSSGNVSTTLTGLTKGVTYYYATYVTLQGYVTKYGEVKSFVTTDAKITTADAADVTAVSATLGGSANTNVATIYAVRLH
jgi:hypothetical protein